VSTYATALALILTLEGGCVDNPADPGGATCYGITQGVYNEYLRQAGRRSRPVTNITRDEVEAIYRERYWAPSGAADWDEHGHPGIALYVFDTAVNHGLRGADSIITDSIHRTLNNHPLLGLALLHTARMEYYANLPHWDTFGRGWTRRIARVYREAMQLEHPDGLLRVNSLDLNGVEWDVGIARIVRERIWARGERVAPPCSWWQRLIGGCK